MTIKYIRINKSIKKCKNIVLNIRNIKIVKCDTTMKIPAIMHTHEFSILLRDNILNLNFIISVI